MFFSNTGEEGGGAEQKVVMLTEGPLVLSSGGLPTLVASKSPVISMSFVIFYLGEENLKVGCCVCHSDGMIVVVISRCVTGALSFFFLSQRGIASVATSREGGSNCHCKQLLSSLHDSRVKAHHDHFLF